MRPPVLVRYLDTSTQWYEDVLANHREEAQQLVARILADTTEDEHGCLVTPTTQPRNVRFRGGQDRAYRFVFCVTTGLAATRDQIVRHRCHNRRCVNPRHLELGDRLDNLRDELERRANGVDYAML